jgi:hypothetical protein
MKTIHYPPGITNPSITEYMDGIWMQCRLSVLRPRENPPRSLDYRICNIDPLSGESKVFKSSPRTFCIPLKNFLEWNDKPVKFKFRCDQGELTYEKDYQGMSHIDLTQTQVRISNVALFFERPFGFLVRIGFDAYYGLFDWSKPYQKEYEIELVKFGCNRHYICGRTTKWFVELTDCRSRIYLIDPSKPVDYARRREGGGFIEYHPLPDWRGKYRFYSIYPTDTITYTVPVKIGHKYGNQVHFIDNNTGTLVKVFEMPHRIKSIALSPDEQVLCAFGRKQLTLIDLD